MLDPRDTEKIATRINASLGALLLPKKGTIVGDFIERLADDFEAEMGDQCDAKGCDEEGHRGGIYDSCGYSPAAFVAKCRGE